MVITANRYLTGGGKVTAGKDYAPNDPANIPSATGPVFKYNFIPNPAVHSNEIDSTRLWGYTMKQLCTY